MGQAASSTGKRSCLLIAVLHDQRIGALFQPVAGFRDDLGPFAPQEVGDHRHEGVGRLLLVGDDEGAVGEGAQGGLDRRLVEAGQLDDVLYFRRQGEVGEGHEDLRFVRGELLREIAEDELQWVVVRRATAQEVQCIGEGAAASAPELPGHPAQEQRLAAGLRVKGDALGLAGLREQRIAPGEVGEGLERGGLVEFFQDEELRAGADAAAAGEDGLAALRQALDEGEELVAVVLGKGFEVVEDEQRLRGAQGIEQEPDALVLRCLRDVRLPQFAGELIEHLEEPRQDEAAELAHAVVVQLAVLHGDEDDALELTRRAVVGGADGERGLAHAARSINQRAPGAGLGIEGFANRFQFLFAPEEGLEAGEVVRDGGARALAASRSAGRCNDPWVCLRSGRGVRG